MMPPFLLTSSFQICRARSAGLPLAERPPVRAMPKPILIGSAARARYVPALASTTAPSTNPMRAHLTIRGFRGCVIASSLPLREPRGRAGHFGGARVRQPPHVVKRRGRYPPSLDVEDARGGKDAVDREGSSSLPGPRP